MIHDTGSTPTLHDATLAQAAGVGASIGIRWTSLLSNHFFDLLIISIWGHVIVAVVRMVGYRIPRNTHNPLASRSLAEFWNRYFFYWAFHRFFKKQPKLHIAFATLCAAGIGNFLYHFMRETWVFTWTPALDTLPKFYSAASSSLMPAVGLICSQLRGHKPKPEDGFFAYHETCARVGLDVSCFL